MQQYDQLRSYSADAEKAGVLHDEQLNVIRNEKWFHLFVPEEYGGLELSLPEAVRLEEKIAHADGSSGWVVTLCAGAAMFVGYFQAALREEIFANKEVCIAGSGKTSGLALTKDDTFVVNGSWPYASGAAFADWFTANCKISGHKLPESSFILKREEVEIENASWNYIGLNATAGHSFNINSIQIPKNRMFTISPESTTLPQPIYRYPFLQMAESTIAINIAGMSSYFFELATAMIANKETEHLKNSSAREKGLFILKTAAKEFSDLKLTFYKALEASWKSHINKDHISADTLQAVTHSSLSMARRSRFLVNEVFPYCGLAASRQENHINQVWRNINTASHHTLML